MKLLSIQQTANFLGYSRQWVWMLIQMKKLKSKKVGKSYTIKESDAIKYASSNSQLTNEGQH